ncbi:MAG: NAD(P)-dependent oxidoreductase, partial [Solirubrobacterales bacterium]|nr:NAD(P)-dependent oxidoreductase [Solirubrobacterales bacterium]
MADETCVAVLGAGSTMGLGMARNLARAGIRVRGWNRTREKAGPLEEDGGEVLDSAREAAQGADVVLTMLSDADAVIDAAGDAFEDAPGDTVWLQMSTIGEAGTDRCAELARSRGVTLFDAPVLGTKQPAEEGELVVLASGPHDARRRVEPIFDAVGQKTIWVGEAGAGTRLKMVANSWVLTVVEGVAETIALAEGLGLDPELLLD